MFGLMNLKAWGIGAVVFAVALAAVGTERWFAGVSHGVAKDKARSDAVIVKMVERHRADLDAANSLVEKKSTELREFQERAQSEYTKLQVENRNRLAGVVAERDRLRDQLSDYASGGVKASDDTVEACRERAATLGRVLDGMVQGYARCTGAAEENASGVRTLQQWSDEVARKVREIDEKEAAK